MQRLIGHDEERTHLLAHGASVNIIAGAPGVGRHTLVAEFGTMYNVHSVDTYRTELTMDTARALTTWAYQAPAASPRYRMAILDVETPGRTNVQNVLLKTLEEPPSTCVFMFVVRSLDFLLPTVKSRAGLILRLPRLTPDELYQVLTQRRGLGEEPARELAHLGSVFEAEQAAGHKDSRAKVLTVLKAIADGDAMLMEKALGSWDEPAEDLLMEWACLAGARAGPGELPRCATLLGTESPYGLDYVAARSIVQAMRNAPDARPRLRARAGLGQLVRASAARKG